MDEKQKARFIVRHLEKLYPQTPIPLNHSDDFTLLIAVLLSAQCTDVRVNTVTPALFRLAKNALEFSKVDVKKVEEIIRPLGLAPRKAKAIVALSKILVDEYKGKVPQTLQELEKLPGVGHKTASVVISQAFGIPAFPVDTHIHRLMTRWGLTSGKNVVQTEKDAKRLFPKEKWNKLHLQIIFYGREYCQARKCFGKECPICVKVNS